MKKSMDTWPIFWSVLVVCITAVTILESGDPGVIDAWIQAQIGICR